MAKQLVELMEGTIGVESTTGQGSAFWFEIATAAAPQFAAEAGVAEAPASAPVASEARVRLLLYVEDNPADLKLVEQLIARRPELRLISAGTGTLGIALARAQQPEVVLMDINLADISGLEAMTELRKDPLTAHIPVVAISANAMPHDIQRGLEAGFFRYLTKPIKVSEFTETLDTALARSRPLATRTWQWQGFTSWPRIMRPAVDHFPFQMRIGLHSGAAVAGVIGKHKFIYDLWGDAVNTASRMESHGLPNTVHCSQATREHLIHPRFTLECRGQMQIKGKGEITTWLVKGPPKGDPAKAR